MYNVIGVLIEAIKYAFGWTLTYVLLKLEPLIRRVLG